MTGKRVVVIASESTQREQATALLLALMMRSRETGEHAERTARIALRIGREMGLSDGQLRAVNYGALLHDIGKLAVPDAILHKGKMPTEKEWTILREHPWRGENLISTLGFPENICAAVGQHHERWNGTGYPRRLRAAGISLEARIVAVADAYDAITQDRCYRKGESHEVACHEIYSQANFSFDPAVVAAFTRIPKTELLPLPISED
jgi:putative nucleotidyltransferase with HDIG domain